MTVLGIDTSAVTCSVALYSDRLLSSFNLTNGPTHSQTLLPAIMDVLKEAKLSVSDLSAIAISAGPGSFTGLRIGISTVKGLAFADQIPCVPVSTLEALAVNARHLEGSLVCPLMDARRGEFYNALFRMEQGVPIRLTPDRALPGETILEQIKGEENLLLLGDGAEKFVSMFPELESYLASEDIRFQNGESVAILGQREANNQNVISCHQLSPAYLRLPQAEREWLEKNKKK